MSIKKVLLLVGILIAAAFVLTACAGEPGPAGPQGEPGPAGPQGEPGPAATLADLTCTECHNDSSALVAKVYQWEESNHSTAGAAWIEEAGRQSCAACHSGASFVDAVAAGQNFDTYGTAEGITLPDATPQDCRTCHVIHTTYTGEDFALRTADPVAMVASGQTFDKGTGNLCVNCHQGRRYMPSFASKDASGNAIPGQYDVTSRFNPHLSNQADMLLGVGGAGDVAGSPAAHYTMTDNACVTCHLGDSANHTFEASVSACVACHTDAEDTDVNGAVTATQEKFDALLAALIEAGLVNESGSAIAAKNVDEATAWPVWVYGFILEDGSMGVHNPKYTNALLDAALAALGK
jgi:nitrate/TMAO reductase-like tetraheme cytochrome c subunit